MLTKEGTGILTQLGIVARHSIPSVPQGKGLMEIAVKTICTPLSKRFDSCTHRDMDSDAARKFYLLTRKEIEKTAKSDKLPTLDQLSRRSSTALRSTTPRRTRLSRSLRMPTASGETTRPMNIGK